MPVRGRPRQSSLTSSGLPSHSTTVPSLGAGNLAVLERFAATLESSNRTDDAKPDPPWTYREFSEADVMALAFAAQSDLSIDIPWSKLQIRTDDAAHSKSCANRYGHPQLSQPRSEQTIAPDPQATSRFLIAATHPRLDPTPEPTPDQSAIAPTLHGHAWSGKSWAETDGIFDLAQRAGSSHPFEHVAPSREQQALLARTPVDIPTLNVRYFQREEALQAVAKFVAQGRMLRQSHLRIVTGKGIGSTHGAVIRPALVHWCALEQSAGRLKWAPEIDEHREFGAVLIELEKASSTARHRG